MMSSDHSLRKPDVERAPGPDRRQRVARKSDRSAKRKSDAIGTAILSGATAASYGVTTLFWEHAVAAELAWWAAYTAGLTVCP